MFPRNSNKRSQMCGGSLIDNGRIISAAHCFFSGNVKLQSATLTFGAHNTSDYTGDEVFVPATPEDVVIHPNYQSPGLKSNDIAIVFILNPEDQADIKTHPAISPICLPGPPPLISRPCRRVRRRSWVGQNKSPRPSVPGFAGGGSHHCLPRGVPGQLLRN